MNHLAGFVSAQHVVDISVADALSILGNIVIVSGILGDNGQAVINGDAHDVLVQSLALVHGVHLLGVSRNKQRQHAQVALHVLVGADQAEHVAFLQHIQQGIIGIHAQAADAGAQLLGSLGTANDGNALGAEHAAQIGMCEEMQRDENVFMMGEDIAEYCGAFGVSRGMLEKFGKDRIMNTPISEQAYVGAGIGAAMAGMRPIVELMFSDFMCVCFDELVNEAPKMRFMFGGKVKVPMVMRTAAGAGTGAAAQHSQSLEACLAHFPGLKVVIPSTPYDAKGLLKTAIRDDNPVMFLEQKTLYRTKGMVPEEEYTIPLGVADVKREGTDCSIITYGRMVQMSLQAAEKLAEEGIHVEVVDIRSLVPLDTKTIVESVKKTHRALIVHEAVQFGGFGGEIAGQIADSDAFYYLDAPIRRLGALSCPIPFNPNLERETFPTVDKIIAQVKSLL